MASHQLEGVLTKYYPKLCSTLTDVGNLLPHFVKEEVITTNDLVEINALVLPTEKVQKLMVHISGPLRAGNTEVFYIMLRIMEEYGHHATQQLAHQIRRSLPVIVDKESRHCGNVDNREMPSTKKNSYKKITNCMFWGFVLLGVLLIPVAILYGHIMVRSEVKMVLQEMEKNKQEIISDMQETKSDLKSSMYTIKDELSELKKAFMVLKDKQDGVPLIGEDLQSIIRSNNDTDSLLDVEHLNATEWYHDLVRNSNKVEQMAPAVVAVHGDNFSNPFYIFDDGHLMRLRVYPNGHGDGEGTHVSVYLHLMKGPHDDKLEQSGHWSLRGTFTIELLNQLNDSDHYSRRLFGTNCDYITRAGEDNSTAEGWGISKFISHNSLPMNNSYSHYSNNSFYFRISYHQIAPVRIKFPGLTMREGTVEEWVSNPFFAFKGGYQMCLKACYKNNSATISLHLMKGPHDDKLEQSNQWPLRGTFTIEVGAWLPFIFSAHSCNGCTDRVVSGNIATVGWNVSIHPNDNTQQNNSNDVNYYFKVFYDNNDPPTLPVNLTVSNFTEKMKNKEVFSSPFFAFDKGYLMYLVVYAAGVRSGEGTHVSVHLYLMKGPHDDKLEQSGHWPLRGTFTIKLLNQLNDSDHYSRMLQFHHHHPCSECTDRVVEGVKASKGWGDTRFISHDTLFNHSNNSYYKSDFLILRISYEDVDEVPNQVAPVSFNITKFSQWLKNKEVWYSSPFFVFEEGYQMCLRVDVAGNGNGEGTHVSVFLYLMKGPHDDELEQSGHWPLRGTFTIELLNQLNDSDHYSREVIYSTYTDGDDTNRVVEGNVAANGWGYRQFISHNTLFNPGSNAYLKNGILKFRISYKQERRSLMDMLLGLF